MTLAETKVLYGGPYDKIPFLEQRVAQTALVGIAVDGPCYLKAPSGGVEQNW